MQYITDERSVFCFDTWEFFPYVQAITNDILYYYFQLTVDFVGPLSSTCLQTEFGKHNIV
jgi:hypothetical protein